MTNADRIRQKLETIFKEGMSAHQDGITVVSGDLHKATEFIPGSHPNQMPSVCNIMREKLRAVDEVLHETPSGKSSTLKIRYRLPR